ncbi:MAG: hypothetical protein PHW62_00395 [Candidatus Ratteibacteria bacterium]|nr:hypothetical protein [Candidatus Ratteibacteria bacterium]
MGKTWKDSIRKINGERREVKVRTINGREQVRVKQNRNTTDKSAGKKKGARRVKGHVNYPDNRRGVDYTR